MIIGILSLAIRLVDINKWLVSKGGTEPWKHFLNNPEVVQLAHVYAGKFIKGRFLTKQKIVDISEFRTFLIHLFVISILWVHFKRADEYQELGDAFNNRLSGMEFNLAVKTFCAAYEHDHNTNTITDEQIREDFELLCNMGGSSSGVTFAEVIFTSCLISRPNLFLFWMVLFVLGV